MLRTVLVFALRHQAMWNLRRRDGNVAAMNASDQLTGWQRWLRLPQKTAFRRAVHNVHLWAGVSLGLYIVFISTTGSVLIYRNELYAAALPSRGGELNETNVAGINAVSTLMGLHKNFLAGDTGRTINGLAAIATLLVAITGLIIWWPGLRRWRRSMTLRRGVRWRRLIWDVHSAIGIWSFAFTAIFALSGVYLCFSETFHFAVDAIQPVTEDNGRNRFLDSALYWLAMLHFGRINGIGISCSGPGVCDQTVKAIWAVFGLAPAVLFVSGAGIWWNRVLRRAFR